jgi:general secretion pathway protein D
MIFLTPHIIHGADDLAAVYKAKVEERDAFLATVYGSNYKDDEFYEQLPSLEDGKYTEDEMDRAEKARREELLKQLYDKSGMSLGDGQQPQKPQNPNMEESQTYVPLAPGDGDGGSSGGSFDSGGGDSPIEPPPPPEAPPPPPPPPPGDGGDGD